MQPAQSSVSRLPSLYKVYPREERRVSLADLAPRCPFVDKILRGVNPGDLAPKQPTRYYLRHQSFRRDREGVHEALTALLYGTPIDPLMIALPPGNAPAPRTPCRVLRALLAPT